MIFTDNLSFFLVVFFILIYNGVTFFVKDKRVANLLLLVGNVVILNLMVTWVTLIILTVLSGLVYYVGKWIKNKKQKGLLIGSIVVLIGLFVLKNYKIADFSLLQRVGLSYILFRYIHYLVESYKQTIKVSQLTAFVNYILFFPNFIAGPIDDYDNFDYWTQQKRNPYRWLMIKAGTFRLVVGVIKKFFLVPIILHHAIDFALFDGLDYWQLGLFYSLIFYSFYILFDFSGYSDIAIGTAYLIGIKTPENFDNPYYSFNLGTFWRKWHMTFSNFLFKYLFKPIVTYLSANFKKSPRLLISGIGYLITFILCGIWHGNTMNFIYWGLWHGVGLIIFKLWETKIFKQFIQNKWNKSARLLYNSCALLFTFIFVSIGWFFFNYQTSEIKSIVSNVANFNEKKLTVETVSIAGEFAYQIYFEDEGSDAIEIRLRSEGADKVYTYDNIPVSENKLYYLYLQLPIKALKTIEVRGVHSTNQSNWNTYVLYPNIGNLKLSPIEKVVFQKETYMTKIDKVPSTAIGKYLYMPFDMNADVFSLETYFIDGYGWAIEAKFDSLTNTMVDIKYKHEDGEWVKYIENGDAEKLFYHMHGDYSFDGVDRNLRPGDYEVRLRYKDDYKKSEWFISNITIPDYVND